MVGKEPVSTKELNSVAGREDGGNGKEKELSRRSNAPQSPDNLSQREANVPSSEEPSRREQGW